MNVDEGPFRRLLRWYPSWWRRENATILLSTLLEAAQRDERTAPTAAESLTAALHGTAARIDRRFALVVSSATVVCAALAGLLSAWASGSAGWLLPSLLTGVVPALAALGLIAVLRERGLMGDERALVAMVVSVLALALNALTFESWSQGFDAADAGVPAVGLAAIWFPLFVTASLIGAILLALVFDALFRRTSLTATVRVMLAGLGGVAAAPLIGWSLLSPFVSAILALGVAALALIRPQPASVKGSPASSAVRPSASERLLPAPSSHVAARAARSTARSFAWIAAAGGAVGITYALTGAHWSPGTDDATVAMGQGITISLISGLPLLSALGLMLAAAPSRVSRLHNWGPLSLVAIALGLVVIAYLYAPSWTAMAPWFQAASVAIGGAIAWWTITRARLPRVSAVLVGLFAGILYAAFVGTMIAPVLAFAAPVLALVAAIRSFRDPATGHMLTAAAVNECM